MDGVSLSKPLVPTGLIRATGAQQPKLSRRSTNALLPVEGGLVAAEAATFPLPMHELKCEGTIVDLRTMRRGERNTYDSAEP